MPPASSNKNDRYAKIEEPSLFLAAGMSKSFKEKKLGSNSPKNEFEAYIGQEPTNRRESQPVTHNNSMMPST